MSLTETLLEKGLLSFDDLSPDEKKHYAAKLIKKGLLSIADLQSKEIQQRDKADKAYLEHNQFGIRSMKIYDQILGTKENNLASDINDHKEILTNYKQVLLNDKEGKIIENEDKLKVIRSLENSVNSMGYDFLTLKELDKLSSEDMNSFLISSIGIYTDTGDHSSHRISSVIRKKNEEFLVSVIDKNGFYHKYVNKGLSASDSIPITAVYNYTVPLDKNIELAQIIDGKQAGGSPFSIYGKLKEISKHGEPGLYSMSGQKTGNCYVKEVEAGIKFALWSRTAKTSQNIQPVKWPISTLEMHKKYTKALIQRLDQVGYGYLTKRLVKKSFEKYKSEKKEISLKNWQKKNERINNRDKIKEKEDYGRLKKFILLHDRKKKKNLNSLYSSIKKNEFLHTGNDRNDLKSERSVDRANERKKDVLETSSMEKGRFENKISSAQIKSESFNQQKRSVNLSKNRKSTQSL